MRRTAVETAALAALLLGGALVYGQEAAPAAAAPPAANADKPKDAPAKSKLEEMLQKALQDNPDLRLAAAKVAEAEAELNRARLLVVQKVGAAYQAIEAQKAAVRTAAAELDRMKQLSGQNAVQPAIVDAAEQKLLDAKAKLAALETEMPYLLGKQPANGAATALAAVSSSGTPAVGGFNPGGGGFGGGFVGALGAGFGALGGGAGAFGGIGPLVDPSAPKPVPVSGRTAERIRAALDRPLSLDFKDATLSEVIAKVGTEFQKANPGLLIKNNLVGEEALQAKVSVHFDTMPLGAVLMWIADSLPGGGSVVVRDYGLVITDSEGLPGAPTLHDFWKPSDAVEKKPAKDE